MKITNYKKFLFFAGALAFLFFCSPKITLAAEQIKTTDYFVGAYPNQVSGAVDLPFALYIGDNLEGVSDPIKSAYFTVSGVYTGSGSLSLSLNSDASTTKAFLLPAVASPTNFEIIYQDETEIINPTSAGTYNYSLDVAPAGVTLSGLGAKLEATYQFAPTACPDGVPANEKIKSTDYFVGAYPSQVNGTVDIPFSLYIGDNLEGVSDPVKSAYFTVSGVYTGSGSLSLGLNDNASTTKTFLLPAVASPTNFEIIYQDDIGTINPRSAGTYNYSFNVAPAGVTVSGLGAKLTVSHRYKPPICGLSYPPYGDLVSTIFDSTGSVDGPAYNSIMWRGALGGEEFDIGEVLLQIAAADDTIGPWDYIGPNCIGGPYDWFELPPETAAEIGCYSLLNNKRYFRYKARLCSTDCSASGPTTPQVDEVIINWSP
jgi:hypothetical protein